MNGESAHIQSSGCLVGVIVAFLFAVSLQMIWGAGGSLAGLEEYLYPKDDLGAAYAPQATTIKLWAPTAKAVSIALFEDAATSACSLIPMVRDENGIWSATLQGDMDGKYYLYDITHAREAAVQPTHFQVNDPYARGCSANTGRTLIYDPAKTNPQGWEQDSFVSLSNNVDAVLYEAHIRDFTIGAGSGVAPANRGKYLGMVEEGAKTPEGEKSGLDHLKELGVTHIHLLPAFDYAGGDETQKAGEYDWYSWGYAPVLYNTPEGSYASDANGTARQKEFKRMVQGFHRQRIGVVLDVVFNHTASTGNSRFSIFDKIVPRYYYRRDASGRYANGTGCGNEFASERPMGRKFIVDSIKHWMTEYHVDGFRFDLMGIEDRETMLAVYQAAKRLNPGAILYGEGWQMYQPGKRINPSTINYGEDGQMEQVLPAERMMTQASVKGTGIAAFNDGIRDNIKGDSENGAAPGFVQGAGARYGGMERFFLNLKGQSTGKGGESIEVGSPNETINYASVHDDHCLWDKLQLSAGDAPEPLRIQMDKLAAGILLTAQGVPFLHSGDEFLRSKNQVKNSYNDNRPNVNPIDWRLKAAHQDVFRFYQGMIALRKAHPAFRMTERAAVDRALEFVPNVPASVVAYVLRDHANGDSWKHILVIYNGNRQAQDLTLRGAWTIVANDKQAGTAPLQSIHDRIHVEPCSLVVAYTDGPCGVAEITPENR